MDPGQGPTLCPRHGRNSTYPLQGHLPRWSGCRKTPSATASTTAFSISAWTNQHPRPNPEQHRLPGQHHLAVGQRAIPRPLHPAHRRNQHSLPNKGHRAPRPPPHNGTSTRTAPSKTAWAKVAKPWKCSAHRLERAKSSGDVEFPTHIFGTCGQLMHEHHPKSGCECHIPPVDHPVCCDKYTDVFCGLTTTPTPSP